MNKISTIQQTPLGSTGIKVDATIQIGSRSFDIYFQSESEILVPSTEAYITASLLPSMRSGDNLLITENGSSQKLLSSFSLIQNIYCSWDPTLQRIQVIEGKSPRKQYSNAPVKRVGTFFSGGVDSFYTLFKNRDEITDLIFIHGFDIKISDTNLRNTTSERLRLIAQDMGKNLIEVETNLRDLLNPHVKWGTLAHGAALATIGHLLSPHFRRIFIPATHTYAELFPWGSHPVLDPLWSTESLRFIHDGCEATRVEKVKLIAQSDLALENLRVCWENPNGSYNCGQCEKCIRTMINLVANEALERCTVFDSKLNLRQVSKLKAYDDNTRAFIKENLAALGDVKETEQLKRALRNVLRKPVWPYYLKRRIKAESRRLRGK